jgi:hypothetical protein
LERDPAGARAVCSLSRKTPIPTIMRDVLVLILMLIPCLSGAMVDPALVGGWRQDAPGAQLIWQVAADGHYQLWGSLNDSGMLEASGGTTVSLVSQARQSGTYSVNAHVLSTDGPLGKARWEAASQQSLAGGLVPAELPRMAQDVLSALRNTVRDAVLVMVEVKDPTPLAHPIELHFYSKQSNRIYVSSGVSFGAGALDLGPPAFPEPALPAGFIDLPRAIDIARANGMQGVFGHAMLRVVSPPRGSPIAVWQVAPNVRNGELARSIDAASGKPLDTARITPMTGTDSEITAAVSKAKGVVQGATYQKAGVGQTAGTGQASGAKAASTNLASCGFQETFVDDNSDYDRPVSFAAIHIRVPVYTFLGDFNAYVPLQPLRDVQNRELSKGALRLQVNFPPGYVICPCTLISDSA